MAQPQLYLDIFISRAKQASFNKRKGGNTKKMNWNGGDVVIGKVSGRFNVQVYAKLIK